jgi:hypothetical protein
VDQPPSLDVRSEEVVHPVWGLMVVVVARLPIDLTNDQPAVNAC